MAYWYQLEWDNYCVACERITATRPSRPLCERVECSVGAPNNERTYRTSSRSDELDVLQYVYILDTLYSCVYSMV